MSSPFTEPVRTRLRSIINDLGPNARRVAITFLQDYKKHKQSTDPIAALRGYLACAIQGHALTQDDMTHENHQN
ncbi:MAG: hypothetical protein ACYDA1_04395 [Vulcanimicrobiaceae bacterium]